MYIAKAYVRLDTLENRLHVMNSVMALGGRNYLGTVWKSRKRISIRPDWLEFVPKGESLPSDFIDCNAYTPNGTKEEAVRLFLQLAQMDEEDAATLPVLFKGQIYDSWMDTPYETEADFKSIKTLTPLEVAEAFKEGRIEL